MPPSTYRKAHTPPTNAVCSFVADFGPKGVKWMAGHVCKDSARPALCHACLNPERGELVATDGQILSIAPVAVSDLSGELPTEPLMFSVEMIKNLKGKCRITAKADGLTAVDESGNTYTNSYEIKRYVNYLTVIPRVANELRARISKAGVKKVMTFVKAAKQRAPFINIDIEANGGKMIVSDSDFGTSSASVEIALTESPATDIHVTFVSSELLTIKNWTGGVWFGTSSTRPAIFDAEGAKLVLLMPYTGESGKTYAYDGAANINAFERLRKAEAVLPEREPTAPEKALQTANLPALRPVSASAATAFAESFAALMTFLFAFFLESETRKLLERLQYLAGVAGKSMAELIPEPSGEPSGEPVPELPEPVPELVAELVAESSGTKRRPNRVQTPFQCRLNAVLIIFALTAKAIRTSAARGAWKRGTHRIRGSPAAVFPTEPLSLHVLQ